MRVITLRNFYRKVNNRHDSLFILLACIFCVILVSLQGCASSAASRGATSQADQAYLQADYAMRHFGDTGGVSEAFQ